MTESSRSLFEANIAQRPSWVDRDTTSLFLVKSIAAAMKIDYEILDTFQYEIDKHVYYYGKHHRSPYEGSYDGQDVNQLFLNYLNEAFDIINALDSSAAWLEEVGAVFAQPTLVCNAYFSWAERLRGEGMEVVAPIWSSPGKGTAGEILLNRLCQIVEGVSKLHLQVFMNRDFIEVLKRLSALLTAYYELPGLAALLLPYSLTPFEKFTNRKFRQLKKPTFLLLHSDIGNIPCWATQMELPFDYYQVFGEHQKALLVEIGISPENIVVTGHPLYPSYALVKPKFSLEDVLVITRSAAGAPMGQAPLYTNRAHMLEFLFRVQRILQKFGVAKARLRPHPAESSIWYQEHIDSQFYSIEDCSLREALERSTLVLGGASTVFLESLIYGVNYVFFEPHEYNGCNYWCNYFAPPYDGSDPRVPICSTDMEVENVLRERLCVDVNFLPERIQREFKPQVLAQFIRKIISS